MRPEIQYQLQPEAPFAADAVGYRERAHDAQQDVDLFTCHGVAPVDSLSGCLRIVIAEDNRDAADTLRILLEMFGHEVKLAETGPAALDAVRQHGPDLLLCDIGLPEMSGYDVARTLRSEARFSGLVMFAWTGYSDPQQYVASAAAGFDRHFSKGGDPLILLNEVKRLAARIARHVPSHRRPGDRGR